MDEGIISNRYAKALFTFAKEKGVEEKIYDECYLLSNVMYSVKGFLSGMSNPIYPVEDKKKLIVSAVDGAGLSPELSKFVDMVFAAKREEFLSFMFIRYIELYRNYKHIGTVRLKTATPIDKTTTNRIVKYSSQKLHAHIQIHTEVDPSLIGGFVFDFNNYRIDASIKTQIIRMKRKFIQKNRRII